MADQPPRRQPSTASSRRSLYESSPSRQPYPDAFSDDFSLEPFSVADGFHPTPSTHDDNSRTPSPSPNSRISRRISSGPRTDTSTEKSRRNDGHQLNNRPNSFIPRHDAQFSRPRRTPSQISALSDTTIQRPLSAVSNFAISIPRTQSSYLNATGPSHPYAMYPQNVGLGRSSSVTTASTIRMPERSYSGPEGPTHPYAMYPQNIVPESEGILPEGSTPGLTLTAPVGFPGLSQNYTRRLGPDGEEADDIIGADGHAEQLPPYTRYPDTVPRKQRPQQPAAIVPPTETPFYVSELPPLSAVESIASGSSEVQINTAAAGAAESSDTSGSMKEKFLQRSRRKLCAGKLPLWAIILIMVLCVILAAILGGVIGHFVGKKHSDHHQDVSVSPDVASSSPSISPTATTLAPTTTYEDATSLVSTPTNLPPLPSGSFTLPLFIPSMIMNSCLYNKTQQKAKAWDCTSASDSGPEAALTFIVLNSQPPQIVLNSSIPSYPPTYGPQVPQINEPIDVTLMGDTQYPDAGPAFYFQKPYDKLVILEEYAFDTIVTPSSKSKRSGDETLLAMEKRWMHHYHESTVENGDKPWFCWWNGTILETFVYLTESVNPSAETMTMTTPTASAQSTSFQTPQATSTTTTGYSRHKRQGPGTPWNYSPYPKILKIEERRSAENNPPPYCQQMQLGPDQKSFVPIPNQMFNLDEQEPGTGSKMMKRHIADLAGRDMSFSLPKFGCECQWLIA